MFQFIKYIAVFFLGCLFIANNPDLNVKVIAISETLKNQVMSLTGKVERNEMVKIEIEKAKIKEQQKANKNEEE